MYDTRVLVGGCPLPGMGCDQVVGRVTAYELVRGVTPYSCHGILCG